MRAFPNRHEAYARLVNKWKGDFSPTTAQWRDYRASLILAKVGGNDPEASPLLTGIALITPTITSQLLRDFDLRDLLDTLRISGGGHALEAVRTAICTISDGSDVQVALARFGTRHPALLDARSDYANRQRQSPHRTTVPFSLGVGHKR
jgi:hypothetical protein